MNNLIKAEFYKQKLTGIFRIYIIIMFLIGIGNVLPYVAVSEESYFDWFYCYNTLISSSLIINMVIATIAAFFYVIDFNDKSIHHVIMSG